MDHVAAARIDFLLELLNGSSTILKLYFLAFLTFYLFKEHERRGLSWVDWFVGLPLGMGVAASLYVNTIGEMLTRAIIWAWRFFSDGSYPLQEWQLYGLMLAYVISSIGMLLIIRMFTRAFFGSWPWVGALLLTVLYVTITILTQ